MFFPGEPNPQDSLFRGLGTAQQSAAIASGECEKDGVERFVWNIVLAGK